MRCPHCQQDNPSGAKFCLECGQRLPAGCAVCGQVLPDGARFCMSCGTPVSGAGAHAATLPESYTPRHLAERILASRSAVEGERKPVTVLFCDMVRSTALAEQLGAEEMHRLLSRFFEAALVEVHRYEGTINQFLGDGFMALFGAPLAHEDDTRRAVLAALDIRDALDDRPLEVEPGRTVTVRLRFGLHTGFVVVGAIGDNLRMDYTAVGDTTHLAARLQQVAEPGAIVVSEGVARLVRGYVRLEPRGSVGIHGRSSPVSIYVVTGHGARQSPLDARGGRPLSHFVGRGRELETLRDLLVDVEGGRGQTVGIVGEPGVGKSRLLLEFHRTLAGRPVRYLEARCLSYGTAIPYLPILDIVRAACRLGDGDTPELVAEKIGAALAEARLDAAGATPILLHLLGVKDPSQPDNNHLTGLSSEAIKARTFETLRQLILRSSHRRPLVLVIEDLHWMDRTSDELVASLVESLAGAPIMLLTTYRPGYRPAWMDKSFATQIAVGRLAASDSLTVVRSILPDAGPADAVAKVILDKAEGNPFFLEELTRAVETSRAGFVVPDTVHGVLAARIDRLPELPKRLLQTASVLGREFPVALLDAVWDGGALDAHLQELVRQEFLYERAGSDDTVYVFKHALTQDVAESTLLGSRRRELHLRAAQALERRHAGRVAELAPILAHHYLQAEAWASACEHAARAADAARAVHANEEALTRYDEALLAARRAGVGATERLRLHAMRGAVHGVLGAFEAARADLETGLALGRETEDARACANLLGALGELWGGHRNYERGLELTREAVEVAERAGDRRTLAEALVRHGLMLLNLARVAESQRTFEHARTIFEELGDDAGVARTLDVLAMSDGITGRVQRSIERGREALRRYEALGDRTAGQSVLTSMGFWLTWAGQKAQGERMAREGLEAAVALGLRSGEAYAHACLAWILEMYGDYGPALREGRAALELARRLGHREWMAAALTTVGRVTRICGAPAQARALHEEMLTTTRELATTLWIAAALAELGEDLIALGDDSGGLRLLDEAIATAGEAVQFVAPPRVVIAQVFLRQRRAEDALATARRARGEAEQYLVYALRSRVVEGQALLALGRSADAEAVLREARSEALAIGAAPPAWTASLALADALTAHGGCEEAGALVDEAERLAERAAEGLPDDLRRSFLAAPRLPRVRTG